MTMSGMASISCLIFMLLAVFNRQAFCDDCEKTQTLTSTGTLTVKNLTAGWNCFNFTNKDTPQYLVLKNLVLTGADNLTIIDNKETLTSYNPTVKVPLLVVVGFFNTTLKFYYDNKTQPDWAVDYMGDCVVNVNSPVTFVNSLVYNSSINKEFSCSYKITNYLPSESIAAVRVVNFYADDKCSVKLTAGQETTTYTNSSGYPDFFAEANSPDIQITVSVSNKAKLDFVLAVDSVLAVCSGKTQLTGSSYSVFPNLPASSSPYSCRKLITANKTITISVDKLEIASGFDSLNIINGVSSAGVVGHYINSALEQRNFPFGGVYASLKYVPYKMNGNLYISSEMSLVVTLDVRKFSEPKNLSISASTDLATQRHISGNVTFPKTATNQYWQFIANENKLVKVNFGPLVGNITATVYNGLQPSDKVLTVLTPSDSKVNPVIGGPEMLVEIKAFNITADLMAQFTSVDIGCDHVSTDPTGQWSFVKQGSATCSCLIFPNVNNDTNVIVLYLDSLKLGGNDTVRIVSGVDNSKVLAEFTTSVSQLQIIGSVQEGLRVVFTKGGEDKSQGSFRYETVQSVCGHNLTVDGKLYTLTTPNFPNQYPLNAQCTWAVGSIIDKVLLFNVETLNLAPGHSLSVNNGTAVLAKYEGTKAPEASLLVPANETTKVVFQSIGPASSVAYGAKFTYQSFDCGNYIQENAGKLSIPSSPTACIWIIEVKNTTKNQVIVNITVTAPKESSVKSSLIIYDGASMQKEPLNYTLNQSILTRYNTVFVKVANSSDVKNVTLSFETYACQYTCYNGICLHDDWRCNGHNDCGDNTDEIDCGGGNSTVSTPPSPTTTAKPEVTDYSGYVKSGWVPACLAIGIILGMILYFAVPRIIHKIKGRDSNYSRMDDRA